MIAAKRAILSVSNKEELIDFARGLSKLGVEVIATDGTARELRSAGLAVTTVSEFTAQPEILGGRVKTLHPKIFGGILVARDQLASYVEEGGAAIDLVVVNLYPFEDVSSSATASLDEIIENIDIGGVALIRAAAKNSDRVAVVTSPRQYAAVLEELRAKGEISAGLRRRLALEAFEYTSRYDAAIYNYLSRASGAALPQALRLAYDASQSLRYGENPHQKAAFYVDASFKDVAISNAQQLWGRELSFNNILDLNAALCVVSEFEEPAAVVIKHTNPSGAAVTEHVAEAYRRAHDSDPSAAYGSVVGINRTVDEATALAMKKHFVEAIIAPDFDVSALEILKKKKNIRLLRTGKPFRLQPDLDIMKVRGGLLVQTSETPEILPQNLRVVTSKAPTQDQIEDMLFASKVVKHVKSNAIVLAKGKCTVGVGAGQMTRVDACSVAGSKAGERAGGSVLASDAFFPFRDGIDEAANVGVAAVIQPGGSIRDAEVIQACEEHGIAMVFSGIRLFKH